MANDTTESGKPVSDDYIPLAVEFSGSCIRLHGGVCGALASPAINIVIENNRAEAKPSQEKYFRACFAVF